MSSISDIFGVGTGDGSTLFMSPPFSNSTPLLAGTGVVGEEILIVTEDGDDDNDAGDAFFTEGVRNDV